MHRHNALDGHFTSMDEMRHALETGITNTDVLAWAQTLQGAAPPRLSNERLIDNVRLARSVFKPNAYYGTRLAANQRVLVDVDELGAGDLDLFVTDGEGIPKNRISDDNTTQRIARARQHGKKVIVFFGGSTIMGTGSRLPALSIPSLVEQILLIKFQIDTVCINRGILGMTSQDAFNILTAETLSTAPDCVIFYTGWNCVFNQSAIHALQQADSSALRSEIYPGMSTRHIEHGILLQNQFNTAAAWKRALWLTTNQALTRIANLFGSQLLRKRINQLLNADPMVNHTFMTEVIEAISTSQIDDIAAKSAKDYLRTHSLANLYCTAENTLFYNFLQPCLSWGDKTSTENEKNYLLNSPAMGQLHRKFYEQLLSLPKPEYFSDLSQVFEKVNKQTYIDTGHLNPYGNFLIAEKIASQIAPSLT